MIHPVSRELKLTIYSAFVTGWTSPVLALDPSLGICRCLTRKLIPTCPLSLSLSPFPERFFIRYF